MLLSRSFQSTSETGLSDFHLITLAVMREKVSSSYNLQLLIIGSTKISRTENGRAAY